LVRAPLLVILTGVKDLGCDWYKLLVRRPDPSTSPKDDRIAAGHELFLIGITPSFPSSLASLVTFVP
jgi:hypothetical protein